MKRNKHKIKVLIILGNFDIGRTGMKVVQAPPNFWNWKYKSRSKFMDKRAANGWRGFSQSAN